MWNGRHMSIFFEAVLFRVSGVFRYVRFSSSLISSVPIRLCAILSVHFSQISVGSVQFESVGSIRVISFRVQTGMGLVIRFGLVFPGLCTHLFKLQREPYRQITKSI